MDAYIRESIPAAARTLVGLFFIATAHLQMAEAVQQLEVNDGAWSLVLIKGVVLQLELGGGWLLVIGWKARAASLVLTFLTLAHAVACIATAAQSCPPIHLLKDLALVGSLLQVASFGAGMYSADHDEADRARMQPAPHN